MSYLKLYKSVDIDECAEGTDGCAQNCSNTIGSYTCSCGSGYRLASDGHSCNGKYSTSTVVRSELLIIYLIACLRRY